MEQEAVDVWGPDCELVKELGRLRERTVNRKTAVGFTKLYERVKSQAYRVDKAKSAVVIPKGRIQEILAGEGRPPTWSETISLAEALVHFEVPGQEPALSIDDLRLVHSATTAARPAPRVEVHTAHHFAHKLLDWAEAHGPDLVLQGLDERARAVRGDAGGDPAKAATRAATVTRLRRQQYDPAAIAHGVVCIGHVDETPPPEYRNVLDRTIAELLVLLQEHKILRPDGWTVNFTVEHGADGFRMWSPLWTDPDDIQAFLALEISTQGSVAVYFRSLCDDMTDGGAAARLVGWGVLGAIRMCLHAHAIIRATGPASAVVHVPNYVPYTPDEPGFGTWPYASWPSRGGWPVPTFTLSKPWSTGANSGSFWEVERITREAFAGVIAFLSKEDDTAAYAAEMQAWFLGTWGRGDRPVSRHESSG